VLYYRKHGEKTQQFGFTNFILLVKRTRLGLRKAIYKNLERTMAYKYNWDSDEKPPEKEMIAYLTTIVPDLVETAFLVCGASDDGGRHIVMMAESTDCDDVCSPWADDSTAHIDYRGWRLMRVTVPDGYLQVFYNTDGSKRKTKEMG